MKQCPFYRVPEYFSCTGCVDRCWLSVRSTCRARVDEKREGLWIIILRLRVCTCLSKYLSWKTEKRKTPKHINSFNGTRSRDPSVWVTPEPKQPKPSAWEMYDWHNLIFKLTVTKNFPDIYGIRMFITVFTKARQIFSVSPCVTFCKVQDLHIEELLVSRPSWRTTPCRLSWTVCAVHLKLYGASTWTRDMQRWATAHFNWY